MLNFSTCPKKVSGLKNSLKSHNLSQWLQISRISGQAKAVVKLGLACSSKPSYLSQFAFLAPLYQHMGMVTAHLNKFDNILAIRKCILDTHNYSCQAQQVLQPWSDPSMVTITIYSCHITYIYSRQCTALLVMRLLNLVAGVFLSFLIPHILATYIVANETFAIIASLP